jgi:hypothetical protein
MTGTTLRNGEDVNEAPAATPGLSVCIGRISDSRASYSDSVLFRPHRRPLVGCDNRALCPFDAKFDRLEQEQPPFYSSLPALGAWKSLAKGRKASEKAG